LAADAVIGQARAGIDAASAETARSRDDNTRYKRLVSSNAVSVESVLGHLRPGLSVTAEVDTRAEPEVPAVAVAP